MVSMGARLEMSISRLCKFAKRSPRAAINFPILAPRWGQCGLQIADNMGPEGHTPSPRQYLSGSVMFCQFRVGESPLEKTFWMCCEVRIQTAAWQSEVYTHQITAKPNGGTNCWTHLPGIGRLRHTNWKDSFMALRNFPPKKGWWNDNWNDNQTIPPNDTEVPWPTN